MTVEECILKLEAFPPDAEVVVNENCSDVGTSDVVVAWAVSGRPKIVRIE